MSALAQLQSDFQAFVLGTDADLVPAIVSAVREQNGFAASDRLAIYHNAYRSRLRQALAECYDKTWSYIGDAMFAELATDYIDAHPSRHPNLRWFGDRFAAFAAHRHPDYPFIAELAALEWSLGLAFDAADAAPLTMAGLALAHIAPEQWDALRFALHPSARLLTFEWNTVAMWQTFAADAAPPDPQALEQPVCWLVWRLAEQPHFRSLSALEALALRRVVAGDDFGAVCEATAAAAAAAGTPQDGEAAMAGFLQTWLAQGVLVSI
jgi:hypothetical protein